MFTGRNPATVHLPSGDRLLSPGDMFYHRGRVALIVAVVPTTLNIRSGYGEKGGLYVDLLLAQGVCGGGFHCEVGQGLATHRQDVRIAF